MKTRFFSAIPQPPSFVAATNQRSYSMANVVLVVFVMLAVACVIIATRQSTTNVAQYPAQAVAATPATVPSNAVSLPVQHDTNTVGAGTVSHVWLNENERAATAKVYPPSARIPEGIDPACFWAGKQGVSCADVQSAVQQMLQWHDEGGDQ